MVSTGSSTEDLSTGALLAINSCPLPRSSGLLAQESVIPRNDTAVSNTTGAAWP